MKRTFRILGSILASGTLIALETLLPPLKPVQAAVGQVCATPGKDGAIGTMTGAINTYYPGSGTASAGATSITVGTARTGGGAAITAGDLLLVIQMQDATIDSTNTAAYGDGAGGDVPALAAGGTQPSNGASGYTSTTAGTFEYVVASAVSGTTITIRGKGTGGGLINSYSSTGATATQGKKTYQVVRVPQYATATLGSATALPWDGSTGGILAYDVAGNLNLAGTVSVDGLGFRGGAGRRLPGIGTATGFSNTDYRTLATSTVNGSKGEGIAGTPRYLYNAGSVLDNTAEGYPNGSYGRGSPGNAGGGSTDANPVANDQNSGGGGGSNGGAGGIGGRSWSSNLPTGGFGGKPFPATNTRLVLGGGGGAGTTNDGTSSPNTNTTGINSSGAAGGGMVIIRTNTVSGSGIINARGATALNVANDGGGGGGAGGSVLVAAQSNNVAGLTVNTNGGRGGDAVFTSAHGPGGGGGGGVLVSSPGASFSGLGGSSGFTGSPATSLTNGAASGTGFATPLAVGTIPGADSGAACLPNLSVTKTTSTSTVTNTPTGTTATYTITVSNEINRSTASNVSISDALPAGFTYASLGTVTLNGSATRTTTTNPTAGATNPGFGTFSIPGGGSVAITFTVNIASSVANNTYDNPATATYNDPAQTTGATTSSSYNPASSTAENVTVASSDLTITKTHTGNFSKGGSNTYTLTATNSGTAATNGTVTVSDTVPTGLTPTAATGTDWACNISGQVVTCTRSDALAANTSYPPITLTVNVAPTAPASITNTATISGGGETNTTNNSVNDPTTINPSADLSLTKVVNNAAPNVGENVTFTVTVSNAGPDATTGVNVTDVLPAGLTFVSSNTSQGTYSNTTGIWSVGTLASATNATLQITATVATAGAKTNTAQVSASGQQDPDSTPNNSVATEDDQASVTVAPPITDLSIVKTDSPEPVIAGANLTYAIAVTNNGPVAAANVVMSDPLPSGTTFQSITAPSGWNCTTPAVGSNSTVSCTNTSMAVGTSNFTLVARVTPNTANNASLSNTATVSSTTSDSNTSNNSSSQTTTVRQSADLRLTKVSTPASPAVGSNFDYTITVTNDGPSTATNVQVTDQLPPTLQVGVTSLGITTTQGTTTYNASTPNIVWNVGTLAPNTSATITIPATRLTGDNTVNTAEVTRSDQPDPDSIPGNGQVGEDDRDSVTVPNQSIDLAVTKTVNNSTPSVGQNVTFTITVANPASSTVTATNIGINDILPQGLTYQSHNESTGTYNRTTGAWSIPSLAPGTTATLTLVAQVTTSGAKINTAQLISLDQSDPNPNNDSGSATVTAANVPPNLILVKRITAVAGTPSSGFNDLTTGSKAADDNNANWPTPLATYLRGLLNGGSVAPGAEVEYTIYFLNNQNAATNITICDPVPANMTFVTNGYNSASPRPTEPGALPTDTGIALASNAATLPINPTFYLTNANDSDRGRYYPPNDPSTPAACKRVDAAGSVTATGPAANTDGAIVVNVVSGANQLPPATASGNPTNSYGYIRFKARVK